MALASATLLAFASASRADQTYHVSFNTSALTSLPAASGPFSLDFQLIDGGDPSNNTATISNFDFGTGGSAPVDDSGANASGTASGGLASGTISLADDDPITNELYQTFTPGSLLSFDVTLTTNPDQSAFSSPDAFTFSILDGTFTAIPTTDPTTADTLVAVDISDTPTVSTFATDTSRALSDGTSTPAIDAPVAAAAVPEASSFVSLGLLLAGLAAFAVRRTRRAV